MTNDLWQARVHRESNVDIDLDCVAMSAPTSDTWEDLSVVRCYCCSDTDKQGTDTCIAGANTSAGDPWSSRDPLPAKGTCCVGGVLSLANAALAKASV